MSLIRMEARIIRASLDEAGSPVPPGHRYRTILDLVDAEGVAFSPSVTPKPGRKKQCFRNAGRLALYEPDRYVYVEGFACLSAQTPLCISHAWVYDRKHRVALDPTWPTVGIEYLGVPFDTDWFRDWTLARGTWGVLDAPEFMAVGQAPERYTFQCFR